MLLSFYSSQGRTTSSSQYRHSWLRRRRRKTLTDARHVLQLRRDYLPVGRNRGFFHHSDNTGGHQLWMYLHRHLGDGQVRQTMGKIALSPLRSSNQLTRFKIPTSRSLSEVFGKLLGYSSLPALVPRRTRRRTRRSAKS
jgi:hypothetical protein